MPTFHWFRTTFYLLPIITVYTMVFGSLSVLSTFWDRAGYLSHRCARAWAYLILVTTGVRVEVRGVERLTPGSTCVFVANHQSIYDIPVVFWYVPFQLRIIAKESLGRIPFMGWHLRRAGNLLVNRSNPDRARILNRWRMLVGHGISLIIFPESTRSWDGRVGRFKAGSFLLAIEAGMPVVPISISGTRVLMPRGRFAVQPGLVTMTIHDPLVTAGGEWQVTIEDARRLAERARQIVASAVEGGREPEMQVR